MHKAILINVTDYVEVDPVDEVLSPEVVLDLECHTARVSVLYPDEWPYTGYHLNLHTRQAKPHRHLLYSHLRKQSAEQQ